MTSLLFGYGFSNGASPRNVVIINDNAKITGGGDKVALMSAIELAKRGKNVYLLAAVGPIAEELLNIRRLTVVCTHQFDILHDPSRARAVTQGLWNVQSSRVAKELFRTLDPSDTIVHLHLWAKALSSSVVRTARDRGFSVVCTLHDYMTICPTGTRFLHSEQQICDIVPMSGACIRKQCDRRGYGDKLWRVARHLVQEHVGGLPGELDAFISLSLQIEAILRPHLPANVPIFNISNFVDVPRMSRADVANNTAVVFCGRLVSEKGPVLLAQAAQRAHCETIFVGEGPLKGEILRACPSAVVTGWLSSSETLLFLRRARCLVVPSLWSEAQPLVVLEALSLGIPCIVADTSAACELIEDGVTGLLFKSGDVNDLQRQLEYMKDPLAAEQMGRTAFERYWKAPRTLESHVSQLLDVYREVLSKEPSQVYARDAVAYE